MSSINFTAAQERVLARQRQREAEALSRIAERQSSRNTSAIDRLPYPANQASRVGYSIWDTIRGRQGTRPEFRVGQVDAELLDEELLELFKGQVGEALKFFDVSGR